VTAVDARQFCCATVIELAVILLIVTNAAASTVTREKEDGTLDLLPQHADHQPLLHLGKAPRLVSSCCR